MCVKMVNFKEAISTTGTSLGQRIPGQMARPTLGPEPRAMHFHGGHTFDFRRNTQHHHAQVHH
jgi:hypothetical protein